LSTASRGRGVQERHDSLPERLDLRGRHHGVGGGEQRDGHAVIVRAAPGAVREDAGAQVAQGAAQITVAPEREHERHTVTETGTAGGRDAEPAREADADEAHAAVAREAAPAGQPCRRVLDHVRRARRDAVVPQVGHLDGEDGEAARGQVAGEIDQPRLIEARGMYPRGQKQRAPAAARGR
jgi:hypothetical protein